MEVKGIIVSDADRMSNFQALWDKWVKENSNSPFLFTGYLNQLFKDCKVLSPVNILIFANNKIIGLFPLGIRTTIGLRYCRFSLGTEFPIEIDFGENTEKIFRLLISLIFQKMESTFLDLVIPNDYKNLLLFEKISKDLNLKFSILPEKGHSVLEVKGSWSEYEKVRGRNLRKMIKRTERCLTKLGKWNVEILGNEKGKDEIFKKILEVEKVSWKNEFFKKHKISIDPNLQFVWSGSLEANQSDPNYEWKVACLELNGKTIAYSFYTKFKQFAFIIKTSFDDRFRKDYLGIYINHLVIKELYNNQEVKCIDFMTNLDFHRKWAPHPQARIRVTLTRDNLTYSLVRQIIMNKYFKACLYGLSRVSENTSDFCKAIYS